jgi:hypothetical protein
VPLLSSLIGEKLQKRGERFCSLPDEYARVEVLSLSPNHQDYEVDLPAPDGEMVLGSFVGYFIAWQQRDIVLSTNPSTLPSTSQLQLTQVEEQVEIGSTSEACVQSLPTYDQQMPSILEETVA